MKAAMRLGVGQLLAFLTSCTGLASTLLVNSGASFPLLQSLTAYVAIAIVFVPFAFVLQRHGLLPDPLLGPLTASTLVGDAPGTPAAERESVFPLATPAAGDGSRGEWLAPGTTSRRIIPYAAIALIDLQANYLIVLAYRYTEMTSAQLLDCFTVPCVMVFSYIFLKQKVSRIQLASAAVAVGGLVLLVVFDADGLSRTSNPPNPVLGDILCLLSSVCYAASNVAVEVLLRGHAKERATDAKSRMTHRALLPSGMASSASIVEINNNGVATVAYGTAEASEDHSESKQRPEEESRGDDDTGMDVRAPSEASADAAAAAWGRHGLLVAYAPVVRYLAVMAPFGVLFATIQFFAIEYDDVRHHFKHHSWHPHQTLYVLAFDVIMVVIYGAMPLLFIMVSATFANLSLLTSDVYSIVWNVSVFKIYPRPLFFMPFAATILGIAGYDTNGFAGMFRRRGASASEAAAPDVVE